MNDLSLLQSHYPRIEGSKAENEILAFIEERLKNYNISFNRFDFQESDLNHSFSSSLEATITGKTEDTLILAVPLNHPPEADKEYDCSINIALAMSILEQLKIEKPPITVKVLFLGAEYGEEPDYPMGSRLFLRDFYPEYRVMVLYLNMKTIPSRLHVRGGGRGIVAPYWLFERCTDALKETDLFFLVRGNENQIFRIGLDSKRTIIEPFLFAGYPAICFEGEYKGISPMERENWVFSFDLFFNTFLKSFEEGIPETWDRHYLFFQVRDFYFSIGERSYLIILITIMSLVLLYALIFSKMMKKYLKTLFRNIWNLPVFILISFTLLFISTLVLEGILCIRRMETLWTAFPLLFLAFKLTLPFLIFISLFGFLKKLHFSRNGSFYSASAILFLVLDILILALINISFTYYFVWALTFTLLFSATSNRPLKILFFLASPYWILKTVIELFALPKLEFCRVILLSKIWGNLLLAVVLIPFILMLIRLRMILRSPGRIKRNTWRLSIVAFFSLMLFILFLIFLIYSPYNEKNKQPILARYFIDRRISDYYLKLSSPAPIGKLYLLNNRKMKLLDTNAGSFKLTLPEIPDILETELSSTGFLDRKNINLALVPKGNPFRLKLTLIAQDEFVLFDSNFPYIRQPGGREYQILIGVNPPIPLLVQLTLPRDMTFDLTVTLEYLASPDGFKIYALYKDINSRSTFKNTLNIKT